MKSKVVFPSLLAMALVWTFAGFNPPAARAQAKAAKGDSAQINQLFTEAKTEAAMLQKDSEELATYQRQQTSWETHAEQLESMRAHVNAIGKLETQLRDARPAGSAWQQEAVDRVRPLLQEMADNLQATINHGNDNPNRLRFQPFTDLVNANADLAADLHEIIAASVDYGQKRHAFEAAEAKFAAQGDR